MWKKPLFVDQFRQILYSQTGIFLRIRNFHTVTTVVGVDGARQLLDRRIRLNELLRAELLHRAHGDKSRCLVGEPRGANYSRYLVWSVYKMKANTRKAVFAALNPSPVFEGVAVFAEALAMNRNDSCLNDFDQADDFAVWMREDQIDDAR